MNEALAECCRLLGAAWARIWLFDEDGKRRQVEAAWPDPEYGPPRSRKGGSHGAYAEEGELVPLVSRRKEPVSADDAMAQEVFPFLRRVARESGSTGIEARPLKVRDTCVGVVVLGFSTRVVLTQEGRAILDGLSEAVALGVLAARQVTANRAAAREPAAASKPALEHRWRLSPIGMLEGSLEEMCQVFEAACAAIWRWDELTGRFEVEASHASGDLAAAARAVKAVMSGNMGTLVYQDRQEVTVDTRDPGASHGPLRRHLKQLGFARMEAVPLEFQGEVLGGLTLLDVEPRHSSPRDRGMLRLVIHQIVAAVAVARVSERLAAEDARRRTVELDLRQANATLEAQAAELIGQRDLIAKAHGIEQRQVARLLELDRLKADFLNAASHELRTPLSSIKGYSEFLADELAGELNSQQHGFVREIQDGAERLRHIVDDMLDFARLEAGTFRVAEQETDLRAVVVAAVSSLLPQARQAGVKLARSVPDVPVRMRVDPLRIEQVILNLVGNAIKFTPKGGRIVVRVRPLKATVRVEVHDSGIGISTDDLERIFEKFFQVDSSTTREHGGAGLGLAIARAIVSAHGGRMDVKSTLGRGSTFRLELPYAAPSSVAGTDGTTHPEVAGSE